MAPFEVIDLPGRDAEWRVDFWIFKGFHDWIGTVRPKRGRVYQPVRKTRQPKKESREFFSREAADRFVVTLRDDYGDEVAAMVVDLRKRTPAPPKQRTLPGEWPYQRRGE